MSFSGKSELRFNVVIPVFNEGENILKTLNAFAKGVASVSPAKASFVIDIVYDFEEDNTLPVVRALPVDFPLKVNLVRNPVRGVVNALKTGLASAEGEYVLVTMADMSDEYDILPQIVAFAGQGYDVIVPSRYMRGGAIHGGPLIKQLLSRIAGVTLRWFSGIPTSDATNSYKAYKTSTIRSIEIESSGGFEIGIELVSKVFKRAGRIIELPTQWWDRTVGDSNFKLMKWLPKYLRWYFFTIFSKKTVGT